MANDELSDAVPGVSSDSSGQLGTPALPIVAIAPPADSKLAPSTQPTASATPTTWAASKPLVSSGQAVLIDARAKPIYDAGHIPGAISFPEYSTPQEFADFQEKYPPSMLLIVYCSSETCSTSKRLADRFVQQYGYQNVRYITGGYQEWQRTEALAKASPGPATAPAPPPPIPVPAETLAATKALSSPSPVVTVTPISWAEAKPLVESGEVILVDARTRALYDASHIPGAVSLPESSTPEEFSAFQQRYGPAKPLVVYCGSQSCSLSKRLADKLVQQHGYRSVRYMSGGFQEWQRAQLPDGKSGI